MSLAARSLLALWSGLLFAAAAEGATGRGVSFLTGVAVVLALSEAAERLAGRASGRLWLAALGASLLAAALPVAPRSLLAALVAQASPQSFPGGAATVPAEATRLLAWLLAWGWTVVVTAAAAVWHGLRRCDPARPPRPAHLVLGLLALYGALVLWGAQVQSLTGDEPHYLLAARSLLRDGDVVLTNDYAERRYAEFYPTDRLRRSLPGTAERELDPHDVPGRLGWRPVHNLGLSLLLLPGYALFGWGGGLATAVLIAVLGGWAVVRLSIDTAEPADAGWLGAAAVVLGSPLLAYAGSLHSEPAALACVTLLAWRMVVGMRALAAQAGRVPGTSTCQPSPLSKGGLQGGASGDMQPRGSYGPTPEAAAPPCSPPLERGDGAGSGAVSARRQRAWLLAESAALNLLPWLHIKYTPLALLLALFLAWDRRGAGARAWLPLAAIALGAATLAASYAWMYGSPLPNAPQVLSGGKFPGAFSGNPFTALPGLLFDQQDGLLLAWPLGLLAAPGVGLLGRRRWARRLLLLLGLHLVLIATYSLWRSGYAPAGRQLLPVVGLLGPFVGAGAAWLRQRSPRALAALAGANAAWVLLGAWLPRLRYPSLDGTVTLHPVWSRLPLPGLEVVLPATARGGATMAFAGVYLVLWLGWGWGVARRERGPGAAGAGREGADG